MTEIPDIATSSKVKLRWYQFSLRSLLLIVTLLCVYFGWQVSQARLRQRTLADQLVDQILVQEHFHAIEANPQINTLVTSLTSDLTSDTPYTFGFLLADGTFKDGTTADEFEQQFVRDVSGSPPGKGNNTADTVERRLFGAGPFRYYRAVRAKKSCLVCHRGLGSSPALAAGDLMAVVKIQLDD